MGSAPATVRQLKALVLLLVISNIGLGIFAAYLLRTTDDSYSVLVGRSVPMLNDLREATARLSEVVRNTGISLLGASPADRPSAAKRAQTSIASDRAARREIARDRWPSVTPDTRAELEAEGDRVDRVGEQIIALVENGRVADATRAREQSLRPAFDVYLDSIGRAADAIEASSLKASDAMSARNGSMSAVVLGIAGWPVIALAALLTITAIFVLVLMILFRGREMGETP